MVEPGTKPDAPARREYDIARVLLRCPALVPRGAFRRDKRKPLVPLVSHLARGKPEYLRELVVPQGFFGRITELEIAIKLI